MEVHLIKRARGEAGKESAAKISFLGTCIGDAPLERTGEGRE